MLEQIKRERSAAVAENIYTALHVVYEKVGYVQKQKPKAGSGLNYSYAGEAALIESLRPALVEAGIIMHVAEASVDLRDTYTNKQGTVMNRTCISATVRFIHAPSATQIDVQALGEGIDAGDKSTAKALTGAYKYALREAFCIETGDDPDQTPSVQQERPIPTRDLQPRTQLLEAQQRPQDGPQKAPDTPANAALRKLYAVAKEKGMGEGDLKAFLQTDSLKAMAKHMMEPQGICDMGHPHNLPDEAAGYRVMLDMLVEERGTMKLDPDG